MHTVFISDLHLEDARPEATEILRQFLQGPATDAQAIYILGDLFEFWIGDDVLTETARVVAAELSVLRQRGVRLYFVHGNRDFLLGPDYASLSGMELLPRLLTSLQFRSIADPSSLKKGYLSGLRLNMNRYAAALTRRDGLISRLEDFLSGWDAWLCPVTVGPAFKHCKMGQPVEVDGRNVPYFTANMSFTSVFNMTGKPVVVLPVGSSADGLPMGIQVVGRHWQDMELLTTAEALTGVTGTFQAPPGY